MLFCCLPTWGAANVPAAVLEMTASQSFELRSFLTYFILDFSQLHGKVHPRLLKVFVTLAFPVNERQTEPLPYG
jgi:hypothetical protein